MKDKLNVKVETLKKAGIEHDWITYIPVDYATESWVDNLLEAGFDKTKKTLFLWQSVSLYLEADKVYYSRSKRRSDRYAGDYPASVA
jgi:O-methyltransferase involved in polyketide biosynthesis